MSKILEEFLKGASASAITEAFFWVILVSLLIAVIARKIGRATEFVHYTATLLTSLGILGTFIGIVVGLLDFDSAHIDESIGGLLSGLKTAFITSLVGMFSSIVFKVTGTIRLFVKAEASEVQGGASADDIYRAINEQGRQMLESSLAQQGLLTDLKRAIVGGEDDTLVSQVKLLRGDMNDNHKTAKAMDERLAIIQTVSTEQQQNFQQFSDKLWLKLQDVADTIAKSATEEVIKALKDVITDFNNNLIEQFGENFKALDESVKKLVVWQENYSQQIEQMVEQYALGVTAINQTKDSVSIISDKSAHIPETMNNLKQVMEVNQHQVEELERHLEAFKDMRDRAVEAVPEIRKQVEATVTEIAHSVAVANEHYTTLLTESDQYIKQHVDASNQLLEQFVANTQDGITAVKTGLIEGTQLIGEELKKSTAEVKGVITEGADQFKQAVSETNQNLTGTSNTIGEKNELMRTELTRSTEAANEHYKQLLEKSDTLINQHLMEHDKATKDLLVEYSEKAKEGIDAVKLGLQEGSEKISQELNNSSKEFMQAIKEGANEFKSSVHETNDSLQNTSNEIGKQTDVIREHLQDTVTELNANVRDMAAKVVDESKTLSSTLQDANQQINSNLQQVQNEVVMNIEKMQNKLETSLEDVLQAQVREVKRTFDALEDEVKSTVGLTGEAVNKQMVMIDKTMEQEVEKVMQSMGNALAMISRQFTNDYERLVNAMADIVKQQGHK